MSASQEMIQHWILNTAIEFPRKLSDFVPFVESESLNVKEVPRATSGDYAAAFLALLDADFIQAHPIHHDDGEETPIDRVGVDAILEKRLQLPRVTSHIRRGVNRPKPSDGYPAPNLRWKMTTLGGEVWERLAKPDWNRYLLTLTDTPPTNPLISDTWSANRDLLMADLGWSRELAGIEVDRDSVRVEILHNHPITYWKVLPLVYHATFSCRSAPDHWPGRNFWDTPEWFQTWWRSLSEWYKKPWELPGWPISNGE